LAEEIATYEANLPSWTNDNGKFVVISGKSVLGVFDTYADAIGAGYREYGLKPFLVRQIATFGVVANFTRALGSECRISA